MLSNVSSLYFTREHNTPGYKTKVRLSICLRNGADIFFIKFSAGLDNVSIIFPVKRHDLMIKRRAGGMNTKYTVIYADPPWTFKTYSDKGKGRSAERHYPTMKIDEICKLPIEDICADDAALFLWVTGPCLQDGLRVIREWGFQYKTIAFTWVKENRKSSGLFWGMGYWTRSNAELCLLEMFLEFYGR